MNLGMSYFSRWDVFKFIYLLSWTVDNVLAEVGYKKLGCYRDNWQEKRPLPHLLFTDRDELSPVYSGKKYIKEKFDRPYLDDLIERCAFKTKEFGYQVFGIERFAECYSGDDAWETYKIDGPSRQCFTCNYDPCDFECEGEPCTGSYYTVFVYKIGACSNTSTPCSSLPKTSSAVPATKATEPTQPTTATPTSKRTRPSAKTGSSSKPTRLPSTRISPSEKKISTPKSPISNTATLTTKAKRITKTSANTNTTTRPEYWTSPGISSRPTKLPSTRRTWATKKTSPTFRTKLTTKATKKPTFTEESPATTERSSPPSTVATRTTHPSTPTPVTRKLSTPTTNSKGTAAPFTKGPSIRIISSRPTRLPSTRISFPETKPSAVKPTVKTKPTAKRTSKPRLGLQHVPQQWACLPHCQVSCTMLCPQTCCMEAPLHHPGIYSFPVLPQLQTVSRYQCAHPCPNACAPRCSSKCCNALYYRSPLFGNGKIY